MSNSVCFSSLLVLIGLLHVFDISQSRSIDNRFHLHAYCIHKLCICELFQLDVEKAFESIATRKVPFFYGNGSFDEKVNSTRFVAFWERLFGKLHISRTFCFDLSQNMD